MFQVRIAGYLLAFAAAVVCCAAIASAQTTTINQTSCIDSTASCLTNGFLQSLSVNCPTDRIANALSSISDRNGPNRITVSGTCTENVNVTGFNRLTLEGTAGATITRTFGLLNSRAITLKSLTFDFATSAAGNITFTGSGVTFDGVTVRSAPLTFGAAVNVGADANLTFRGAPSFITDNAGDGLAVIASTAVLANVTISNNRNRGIWVGNGGKLGIANHVGGVPAPLEIFGNGNEGIHMEAATLSSSALGAPAAPIHIHDNGAAGLLAAASVATLRGPIQLEGNGGSSDSNQVSVIAGTLGLHDAVAIDGNVTATLNSALVILGENQPVTITGETALTGGTTGLLAGTNTLATLSCDTSSWMTVGGTPTIGANTCPATGPAGVQGPPGPAGPAGPSGVSAGSLFTVVSRTIPRNGAADVSQFCPAGKVVIGGGFSTDNPSFSVVASVPEITPQFSRWFVQVRNTAGNTQTGNIGAYAVCAAAQ